MQANAEAELVEGEWRERLSRLSGIPAAALNLTLQPDDQMLGHSLAQHRDAGAALSQYFAISLQQASILRQIRAALPASTTPAARFLDFACGYGRLLRFVAPQFSPKQCWASDIQAEAVEFVTTQFGVHGLPSFAEPERFAPEVRFELIWVASLFSHLPAGLFEAWLERLWTLTAPGGALCFSVRDPSQLPSGATMPANGLLYATESENPDLDGSIYGTTHASEAFVRAALARFAPEAECIRLPRLLANEQDLYIAVRDPMPDPSALRGVRRGPWGWVDIRRIAEDRLDLQGWAASLDDGSVEAVEGEIKGTPIRLQPSIERPDVANAFDDPRLLVSGWALQYPLEAGARRARVHIEAVDRRGERTLLYAGPVA